MEAMFSELGKETGIKNFAEETLIIPKTGALSAEEFHNLEGELAGFTDVLKSDPVASYRLNIEQSSHPLKSGQVSKRNVPLKKQVDLTAFISIREGSFPAELNEKQAQALMGIAHPMLNARGKVDACWALDRISKELGLEWEVLIKQIENIAKIKKQIKELKMRLDLYRSEIS